jgi:hypothetical protein
MHRHALSIEASLFVCLSALAGGAGAAGSVAAPAPDARCAAWRVLTPVPGDRPAAAFVRPAEGPLKVPSDHFVVHYAQAGLAAYAADVSGAAELAYRTLVDTLQHLAPLPDGVAGGDARVDIYLRTPVETEGAFGVTYPETALGSPHPNSYTAWVEVMDTLSFARRVTVTAHEVYHTIQVAYDRFESVSLLEMFSTWAEERVYDDYNLNRDTLRLFFRQPHRGLFVQLYTNVPWAIYLTERFGDAIMEETLSECAAVPGSNPRGAFDAALGAVAGTTFLDTFVEFGTFNYFVGTRDDGAHYTEGATYFPTVVERRSLCYPEPLFISGHSPAELGANYALLDGDAHSDPLWLTLYPEYLASTIVTLTRFKGAARVTTTSYYPQMSTPVDSVLIADWGECDSVLVVYQVDESLAPSSFAFRARQAPAAPGAGPWVLVLDRDGCRAPFDGNEDEFSDRDGEELPLVASLRGLGATVVAGDSLPASLDECRGVFVVGGFDDAGVNLSGAELSALGAFMDAGGDVYVEGSRLGEFMDPSLGAGDATEQAFWLRFGCSFLPGSPSGNVGGWETTGNAFIGTHAFSYDPGPPDAFVGRLVPGSAAFLARDGGKAVRATALTVGGTSTRIMSTVLLGASTGVAGSTREAFLNDVMTLFSSGLAALSVVRAVVSVDGREVRIEGVLEHYDGQRLRCERESRNGRAGVDLDVARAGGEWRFLVRDRMDADAARYELIDDDAGRVLWEERVQARTPALALRLVSVYPSPARENVRLVVESALDARAEVGLYDAAGRRVREETASLRRGANVLYLRDLPERSGVYFVRIAAGGRQTRGRLLVLR